MSVQVRSGSTQDSRRRRGAGSKPRLIFNGCEDGEEINNYIEDILQHTPLLRGRYKPPPVWGSIGHIQTAVFSLQENRPGLDQYIVEGVRLRHHKKLPDGSTISFDIFQPSGDIGPEGDVTVAVCPGLANSSNDSYMRAFATHASINGYRVAVLNYLGVLEDEELTSPRLFTFGSTEEYGAMVREVLKAYPHTKLIAVGFSLGANIVCKYLGENVANQRPFLCCLSLCQGYDFNEIKDTMSTWTKMKKFYAKQLTNRVRVIAIRNWDSIKSKLHISEGGDNSTAVPENLPSKERGGKPTKKPAKRRDSRLKKKVLKCQFLPDLDELVTIKLTGHESVHDYYRESSASNYLKNIDIPTLYVNAKDDPLFAKSLLRHPKDKARSHRKTLFVLTTHGGHLGFYTKTERATVDPFTWLDRAAVEYISAVVHVSDGSRADGAVVHVSDGSRADGGARGGGDSELTYPVLMSSPKHRSSRNSTGSPSEDTKTGEVDDLPSQHDYNMPSSWSTNL